MTFSRYLSTKDIPIQASQPSHPIKLSTGLNVKTLKLWFSVSASSQTISESYFSVCGGTFRYTALVTSTLADRLMSNVRHGPYIACVDTWKLKALTLTVKPHKLRIEYTYISPFGYGGVVDGP